MSGPDKSDKTYRILRLYDLLINGTSLSRRTLCERHRVSLRSVERDAAFLNGYLGEIHGVDQAVRYDEKRDTYFLTQPGRRFLSGRQILAVTKILLASRAFPRDELSALLENLTACALPEEREFITHIIRGEAVDYQPVSSVKPVLDLIWEISRSIEHRDIIRFDYVRQDEKRVRREAEPAAVLFSDYYFYLLAYYVPPRGSKPVILRLDRIEHVEKTGEKAAASIHSGTEAAHRRTQFMYGGKDMTITFKFWGDSWQAVLDRMPDARVIGQDEDGKRIIQAQVMGEGVKMWLLSQMDKLEVLSPPSLREEMVGIVRNLKDIYQVE